MAKNNNYWIDRIANETYKIYNSLEEKNRALLEMYQEATLSIQDELFGIAQKINQGKTLTLSDMHKYNRLSVLKKNIENIIEQLTENVESFGTINMINAGKEVYKNVRSNIQDISFSIPNQRVMEEMLNKPWHGGNFSKRLWKNTQTLAMNLNDILTIGLTQGKTTTEIAVELKNRMNKGFNDCHKLVRTETMHYLNESAFKAYKDGGCEEVEIYAAKDERTCEICGARHKKKYKIDKRPILPFHPNCRCTYLPVTDIDNIKKSDKNNVLNFGKSDIIEERNMANGSRRSVYINLSDEDKEYILGEIEAINANKSVFIFRDGYGTGYSDNRDKVYVSSNVFPSNDGSIHPRDIMSVRATLAHEYYGHRMYRGTKLTKGIWNDEFRASYMAAKNCPNLSDEDRIYLILDALERAKEAGVSIRYNKFIRRILYGN